MNIYDVWLHLKKYVSCLTMPKCKKLAQALGGSAWFANKLNIIARLGFGLKASWISELSSVQAQKEVGFPS